MADELGSLPVAFVAQNPTFYREILASLNNMRLEKQHCDVVFKVGEESFPVHRVVLAASSPYFRAMFASFAESQRAEISLQGVDSLGVSQVLTYFYTGQVKLNHLNFESVFNVVNLWQEPFILGVCEKYLRRELNVSNCLGIYLLTQQYGNLSPDLKSFVEKFVFTHFGEIFGEEEFLILRKEELVKFVSSSKVRVKSEERIFEAVLTWLRHDLRHRASVAFDVLSQVRFGLMNKEYLLGTVLAEEIVQNSEDCTNLVSSILNEKEGTGKLPEVELSKYVYSERERDVLYVFGGLPNANQYTIEGGNSQNSVFHHYPYDSRKPRGHKQTVFLDVALGDSETKELTEIYLAEAEKQLFPAVVMNNAIYALGILVKKFDTSSKNWSSISTNLTDSKSLDVKNSGICVCGNAIYVIGGTSGAKWFDTTTKLWRKMAIPMVERYRPGVCSLSGRVYVLGGCDRTYSECQETVEVYDPAVNKWTFVASMPTARWGPQAVVLNEQIFVIGGKSCKIVVY